MLEGEVLVGELLPVDGLAAGAVTGGEVAALGVVVIVVVWVVIVVKVVRVVTMVLVEVMVAISVAHR